MTPPQFVDPAGRPFRLDRHLASGGEGAVFTLPNDPARVAKVYHRPPSAETVEKLRAMVALANPKPSALSAWPGTLLQDARTRQVAGFVMPRLTDCQPIQSLYNPVQRLKHFPRAGWAFQLRAAQNLAAAFDQVHRAGCLVCDVNQSNVQVSPAALVRLIDCDSFQVRANGKQFLCDVGTPHYVPPELQGRALRGLPRTENHDRFGLAVLIYQLSFVGRHPYAGRYSGAGDPSFDRLIAEFRFAQGPLAGSWGMSPPPHTPTFADIPPDVGTLFRRAFERGSEAGTRPTPADWLSALKGLEQSIAVCPADSGHQYWRGATGCPWCRVAAGGGPEYYFGVSDRAGVFVLDAAKLADVERRLAAAAMPEYPAGRDVYRSRVRVASRPLPDPISRLRARCDALRTECGTRKRDDDRTAAREEEQRVDRENALRSRLESGLRKRAAGYEAELSEALAAAIRDREDRRFTTGVLAIMTAAGGAVAPLACLHVGFGILGALVVLVFGGWLGFHLILSGRTPAQQAVRRVRGEQARARDEAERTIRFAREEAVREQRGRDDLRRDARSAKERELSDLTRDLERRLAVEAAARGRALRDAVVKLAGVEAEWGRVVETSRGRHAQLATAVQVSVAACRELQNLYQVEVRRLSASAEAIARDRHLRLHLLADADVPKIGEGRKQTLAAHGVVSAADVGRDRISAIRGFGESLTGNLMAWRADVERQFRFDPKAAIPPGEHLAVVSRHVARQRQLLTEAERLLCDLETVNPRCRSSLEQIAPRLREAVLEWERADVDSRLLPA